MNKPLVTVAIPFYNAEKFLINAVKSIYAQTFQDWELILIDDGSNDRSLEIAKSIKDPRVRVISDGMNKKLPARLNQIIDLAQGDYIARMDADDMCAPDRFEKQLRMMQAAPELDVVGSGIVFLDNNDVPVGIRKADVSHSEICRQPYRTFGICHASIMAKRSWYEQNRYDDKALLVEDFNLWLESYEKSHFANISEPLYYYRCETSFSQKKLLVARLSSIKILLRHYLKRRKYMMTIMVFVSQLIKMIIGPIICLLASKKKLLEKRYERIDIAEKQTHMDVICYIKDYGLPLI